MSEEIIYDVEGYLLMCDLCSYGVLKIGDISCDFCVVLVSSDDKVGLFGVKSILEIGVNGVVSVIVIVIYDVCGIWLCEWYFILEKIFIVLEKI